MFAVCKTIVVSWLCALDDFDLYDRRVMDTAPASEHVRSVASVTLAELAKLKSIVPGRTGALILVRTDEDHWSKLLVGSAFRRSPKGDEPILVVQQFHTFRADGDRSRQAAGKDIQLFDGFRFNLDIGQVVPDGHGGDILFRQSGTSNIIEAINGAKLYVVARALVTPAETAGPSRGPVVAEDFAGKYRLVANGQWSGSLTLTVLKSGEVNGTYVSDQSGRDFPVEGFVANPSHRVKFTVKLPQVAQEFDGYLWTRGKSAIAGTTTLAGRTFGWVATREGAELFPADD